MIYNASAVKYFKRLVRRHGNAWMAKQMGNLLGQVCIGVKCIKLCITLCQTFLIHSNPLRLKESVRCWYVAINYACEDEALLTKTFKCSFMNWPRDCSSISTRRMSLTDLSNYMQLCILISWDYETIKRTFEAIITNVGAEDASFSSFRTLCCSFGVLSVITDAKRGFFF